MNGTRATHAALLTGLLSIGGCASNPPTQITNVCKIFQEKPQWHAAAKDATKRWGSAVPVLMAIMYRESSFRADVRPPRRKLLGVIPWTRPSNAYGYAQALDSTWAWYQDKSGNHGADRDEFDDAVDFIAWYTLMSKQIAGIPQADAYRQYLAYHEGQGGYKRGSYKNKTHVKKAARQVSKLASRYQTQYQGCANDLPEPGWFGFL